MTEHQVVVAGDAPARLGSRISARFTVVGFHDEVSEQRRQPVRPAEFNDH